MNYSIPTDDVGSFPIPKGLNREDITKAASLTHRMLVKGTHLQSLRKNKFINSKFLLPVLDSFQQKRKTGINWPNYPQFRNMNYQFLDFLESDLTISYEKALIPELCVIQDYAQENYDQTGEKIECRVCIAGPLELGLQLYGPNLSHDVVNLLAESVNKFIQNSCIQTEYFEVPLIVVDEPSLGVRDITNVDDKTITTSLVKALEGTENFEVLIHLHSLTRLEPVLEVPSISIIGAEFANEPSNIAFLSNEVLNEFNKKIRAGVAITSLDSLVLKYVEKHGVNPKEFYQSANKLIETIESVNTIKSHLNKVFNKFGKNVALAGPDCGLGAWIFQEVALELLQRVNKAVTSFETV